MNVIVILTDSYRWDHLGHNGNSWIKTPNLDAFSKECAIFDNCYTDNLPTLPQRTTAFTGRFSFPFRAWESMAPEDDRFALELYSKGIYTAMIFDSFPFFSMETGFTDGFQYSEMIRGYGTIPWKKKHKEVDIDDIIPKYFAEDRVVNQEHLKHDFLKIQSTFESEGEYSLARTVNRATTWLDSYDEEEPFMLWLDLFDPHEPWIVPDEYWKPYADPDYDGILPATPDYRAEGFHMTPDEAKCCQAMYAGNCTFVDKYVGKLFDFLRKKDMMDDTMIIYTSDHGEPLGPGPHGHGLYRKFRPFPYEELAHVPLLVRNPSGAAAGKRLDTFVQTNDITVSILDAFNVAPTEKMNGISLLPVMHGEKDKIRDFAFACHNVMGKSRSIRTLEWTYIYWPQHRRDLQGSHFEERPPELYRRDKDLTEQNNVIADYPEIAQQLELKIRLFEDRLLEDEHPETLWEDRPR
ncbi:sulfatase [Candidatus Hydrogenedentota bacterium]